MKRILTIAVSALLAAPLAAFAIGPVEGDKSFTISGSGSNDKDFDNGAYGVSGELGYFRSEERRVGKEGRSRWAPDH